MKSRKSYTSIYSLLAIAVCPFLPPLRYDSHLRLFLDEAAADSIKYAYPNRKEGTLNDYLDADRR